MPSLKCILQNKLAAYQGKYNIFSSMNQLPGTGSLLSISAAQNDLNKKNVPID